MVRPAATTCVWVAVLAAALATVVAIVVAARRGQGNAKSLRRGDGNGNRNGNGDENWVYVSTTMSLHGLVAISQPNTSRNAIVDYCYSYDESKGPDDPNALSGCGQEAANAFCQVFGYDEATKFNKSSDTIASTIHLRQLVLSPKPNNYYFESISCIFYYHPKGGDKNHPSSKLRHWWYPSINSDRHLRHDPPLPATPQIDYCTGLDSAGGLVGCGQEAADAFCTKQGYKTAWAFAQNANMTAPTVFLQSNITNPNPKSDGFTYIYCIDPK